jgi:hypothetical protein
VTPALRRAWWVVGTLAAAVLLWFVWSVRVQVGPSAPIPAPTLAVAAPVAVDSSVASEPMAPETPSTHGEDEIELCGGLWVKAKEDGSVDAEDLSRVAHLPEARARLQRALRNDGSDFAQAAAIWLELAGGEAGRLAMVNAVAACNGAECESSRQAGLRVAAGRDALARLAATTSDPQVYALAMSTCSAAQSTEGACQMLSPEQWARLDPGNATPWLFILQQAGQRRDVATQNDALYRIAMSRRSEQYSCSLPGLVLDHVPADEASMPVALTLSSEALDVEKAWALPGYTALYDVCRPSALRDANRRQTCAAVAELLVDRADTLLERGIGVGLGRRLGWPDERVDRLQGEVDAYAASLNAFVPGGQVSNCAEIRRDLAIVQRHVRLGEAGGLREWVARSGRTAEDFIRVHRESARAAAAAAASAASAAR